MSKLEELINELCPNGVEFKKLNDICICFNGMTGVSNKWKEDGNCKFIDYLNVYNNLKVDVSKLNNATVKSMNQNTLKNMIYYLLQLRKLQRSVQFLLLSQMILLMMFLWMTIYLELE